MKSIVVYFSHTGENIVQERILNINKGYTEIVAEKIAHYTGADIFKIEEVVPYPVSYTDCNNRSESERRNGILPEIKAPLPRLEEYDLIYLGFPIWYRSYPKIIESFLRKYDLTGKTVKPFCTNEEGTFGIAEIELMSLFKKKVNLKNGFSVRGYNAAVCDEKLQAWLNK